MANITTKDQERKALNKIIAIIEGLGPDSYLAAAFEGCFEVATQNIDNDWACSLLQRAQEAEKQVTKLKLDNVDLRFAIKNAKEASSHEVTKLQLRIEELEHTLDWSEEQRHLLEQENNELNAQLDGVKELQPKRGVKELVQLGMVLEADDIDRRSKVEHIKVVRNNGYITNDEAIDLVCEYM